jgi:hypothetical protein
MDELVEFISQIVVVNRVDYLVSWVDWLAIVDDELSDVHSSICACHSSMNTLAKYSRFFWVLEKPKNKARELSAADSNDQIRFSSTKNIFASNFGRFEKCLVVVNHMLM